MNNTNQEGLINTVNRRTVDNFQPQATDKLSQKPNPDQLSGSFFCISISAVLESAECDNENYLQCKWDLVAGNDWKKLDGQTSGMTQAATSTNSLTKKLVWNYPIDVTYGSLNPFGWPQLVLTITGPDFFGRSVVRAYGCIHVPVFPGSYERTVHLFKPLPMSLFTGIFGYMQGRVAEYDSPIELLAKAKGREDPNLPKAKTTLFCIKRKVPIHLHPDREIKIGNQDHDLCDNSISTCKYNLLNFLPKNLLIQFSKLANTYFLVIGLLQLIPAISTSGGVPYIFIPLVFIVIVSAIKDLMEDLKRRFSDSEENNKKTHIFRNGDFVDARWKEIRVGDIVKVMDKEIFPADMLLLKSTGPKGACYIETKSLDGETNLKNKSVKKEMASYFSDLSNLSAEIQKGRVLKYDRPNASIYKFNGKAIIDNIDIPLTDFNFCLRGCSLRNTEYVYGVAGYTGHDTKTMLNSVKSRAKKSTLEIAMGKQIAFVFVVQIVFCIFSGLWAATWYQIEKADLSFLDIDPTGIKDNNYAYNLFARFGNWLLIFTNFVPISLIVTLEVVKLFQSGFLAIDPELEATNGIKPTVQTSNLIEELGQVEYVFSDKTGTLTQNFMEFKNFVARNVEYGSQRGYKEADKRPQVTNVDFLDERLFQDLSNQGSPNYNKLSEALFAVAICHTVIVDEKDGQRSYNASSPDELALINFAKFVGIEFKGIDESENMTVIFNGQEYKYTLLHVLEFNSTRKRMSVIVNDLQKNQIVLYTKGADNIIIDRMKNSDKEHPDLSETKKYLSEYGKIGLRTLLIAKRVIDNATFQSWDANYKQLLGMTGDNKDKLLEESQELIEVDLELIGATAIEDKLQIDVGITISALKEAGIRVWVLTGDKQETAINIAYSCKLLSDELEQLIINDGDERVKTIDDKRKHISQQLSQYQDKVKGETIETAKFALIITGPAMEIMNGDAQQAAQYAAQFMNIASVCKAVIACRVSPAQKQGIVEFVRRANKKVVTLAIGDGANDVSMITAAHVGIGLRGVEGQQAARASDFAIGEFRFLHRLLFVYGRESYRKNSYLILYNFFKNMVLVLPNFWFAFLDGFSGQVIFNQVIIQFFNILFASVPIVVYAVFDMEVDPKILMRDASYYLQGPRNLLFNAKTFWFWFFNGAWQAVVVVYYSYYSVAQTSSQAEGGVSNGFWTAGQMSFTAVVLIVNIKIILFSNTFHFLNIIFIIGSILVYILTFYILNLLSTYDLYGDFSRLFQAPNFYFGLLVSIVLTNGIDNALTKWNRISARSGKGRKQYRKNEKELKPLNNKVRPDDNLFEVEVAKVLKEPYTGFAFSGQEKDEALMNAKMIDIKDE